MRHPLCNALAVCVSLGFTLPSPAQHPEPAQIILLRPPDHAIVLPLSITSTYTYLQTSPNGKTTSQQEIDLLVTDAQGRRYTANTVVNSNFTTYAVDDPIAGIRYVWTSSTRLAKALNFPEPRPGQKSCWKLPPGEVRPAPGELHVNIIGTTCMPADYPFQQPPYCKSQHLPTSLTRDFPLVEVSAPSCASLYPQQALEDLGTRFIKGFEARGCRTTTTPPSSPTTETWSIQLTSGTLTATPTVYSVADFPGPDHQDKTLQEVTALKAIEPDPSIFRPPPGYDIQTVAMHEVPCGQPANPN